jgi:hypothetical protein
MRIGFLVLVAALLTGCGFGDPAPTPFGLDCGVEDQGMGTHLNQEGRRCLLDAFEDGTRATFVSRMTTIEGDPIVRTYSVWGQRDLRIAHDARRDKFGSGKIEYLRCRLVPVADWNRTQVFPDLMPAENIFVEDGCVDFAN